MERKLISIKDAARVLGVSSLTLRNWDKSGKLPAMRHPMNNYRVYKIDDINRLIDSMSARSLGRVANRDGVSDSESARSRDSSISRRKLNVKHLEEE